MIPDWLIAVGGALAMMIALLGGIVMILVLIFFVVFLVYAIRELLK